MKKITLSLFILMGLIFSTSLSAQTLNQNAGWPNTDWTITGTYNSDPLAFEANPTLTSNFAYDDDDAGNSAHEDNIAAESPIIDLTAAFTAGETWLTVSADYVYYYLATDELVFQYWDADAMAWVNWGPSFDTLGTTTTLTDNFCSGTPQTYTSPALDIAGFTATQQSGFRYRISYDDNPTGTDWNYGFCFQSPTIISASPNMLDYYNLQWPASGAIAIGGTFDVYAQAYEAGLTDATAGQAPGIQAWIGYSTSDTDPSGAGWTWVVANFNVEAGNNDEYTLNLGASIPAPGTYYYASRWSLNSSPYTYGGIQADGSFGGTWGDNNNGSGVLTVSGPANDDCAGAIMLTVSADLTCPNPVAGTTIGSSQSLAGCVGTANDDVWFSFVATSTAHSIITTNTSGSTDIVTQVFDGCGGNSLVCQDTPNSPVNVAGLTMGNTYYFRIYSYSSTATTTSSFNVCVGTPPPPPGNDVCSGAVALVCDTPLNGTTIAATGGAGTSCVGSIGNDVWYQFSGNDSTVDILLTSNTANEEPQVEVFSSTDGTCSGFTIGAGACYESAGGGENPVALSFDAIAGTEYFIRIGNWINGNAGIDFTIAATCTAFPACGDPTGLDAIAAETTADISWVAPSAGTPTGYNWEVQPDGVAQGTAGAITGTSVTTSDTVMGLSGTTAYDLYVQTDCGVDGTSAWVGPYSFTTLGPPPANDDCPDAVALTPGLVYSDNPVDGTVVDATADAEDIDTCGEPGPGVWYSVVVPGDGNISIETGPDAATNTTTFDSVIEVFTGVCGSLVSIACDDDAAATANFSLLNLTGLTPGSTIYIRVWEYAGDDDEPFSISAYSATLSAGEVENPNAFSYFPNPVKNTLKLRAQSNIQNVTIYNMLGQEVLKSEPNALDSEIDMISLQTGAYFVKVNINDVTETIRVIKQ